VTIFQNTFFSALIIALGFIIVKIISKTSTGKDRKILNRLWLFHLLISTCYYFYTRNGGGDAWGYWIHAQQMKWGDFTNNLVSSQGTEFMNTINYIPANILGMGFFPNTLLYGLLGFIAFIYIYRICIQTISYNSKFYKYQLFPLLLFLPNLHFWSSGIGKDTMLFLCTIMTIYGSMRISKRFSLIVVGLLLSYGIRPHITLILVISLGLAYILNRKVSIMQRIFLLIPLIVVAVIIIPSVLTFVKMDELSFVEFGQFSENQAIGLSYGGSFVDISSYPYPLKVLTFLYRPFFFDINGIPALIASFENLLLLLLSIKILRNHPIRTFKAAPLAIQGLFIFSILGILSFSMSMSNLGIILRMRNMFLPGLIIFILWSFSYQQKYTFNRRKKNSFVIFDEINSN
jgi:hypothetical protein